MMEQRMMLVVLAVMCCLCHEVRAAQVAVSHTVCSNGGGDGGGVNGACGSGTAHSSSTGPDGITTGECAYTDPQGQSIKIKYREYPDGRTEAQANDFVTDPVAELGRCREAVEAGQLVAQQNFDQIQAQHQQLQEQIQTQQRQLQDEIFRQQQAIFNPRNFPLPVGFNPIQFPNFHQAGFGPQF